MRTCNLPHNVNPEVVKSTELHEEPVLVYCMNVYACIGMYSVRLEEVHIYVYVWSSAE